MKAVGWIFVAWLIGSIIYSLSFTARACSTMRAHGDPLNMANQWCRRMVIIQVAKGIIAFFVSILLLK